MVDGSARRRPFAMRRNMPLRNRWFADSLKRCSQKPSRPASKTSAIRVILRPARGVYRSADLSGPAFPIGRAQFALQDLASPGKRKRLAAELDAARAFIMGDRLSAMGDDVLGGGIATFLEDHDGVDGLAPFLARDRDHRALRHGGMIAHRVLDLGGIDVLAASDDHILETIDDV